MVTSGLQGSLMDGLSLGFSDTKFGSGSLSNGNGNKNGFSGNGGSVFSVGRGATRGRRDWAEEFFLQTRPEILQSKQGEGGINVQLVSNYFELITKPNWQLLQYRVDMMSNIIVRELITINECNFEKRGCN